MDINHFDIRKFIENYEPFRLDNQENFASMQNSIEELLLLFKTNSDHVFSKFPLDEYTQDDIELFFKMIFENKNNESREAVSLLNKIDYDKNLENWILYNHELKKEDNKKLDELLSLIPQYNLFDFESETLHVRNFIRSHKNDVEYVLKSLKHHTNSIFYDFLEKEHSFFLIGIKFKDFNYLKEFLEYVVDSFLQIVVYCIIANNEITDVKRSEILIEINNEIEKLSGSINFQIERKRRERKKAIESNNSVSMKIENASLLFYYYLYLRNKYGEQINICKELKREEENEPELFKEVAKEYMTTKESCDISKKKKVITEGIEYREYSRKLKEACEIIESFRLYGGRDISSDNTQDVKVHFRELFVSKSRYKVKTMTIARKYLEACKIDKSFDHFEKQSEYLFLREKITRGYHREKNTLFFYHMKNEMQEKFYDLMINTLLVYDYNFSLEVIHDINKRLLDTVLKIYNK